MKKGNENKDNTVHLQVVIIQMETILFYPELNNNSEDGLQHPIGLYAPVLAIYADSMWASRRTGC